MPLPRYLPVRKKQRLVGVRAASLDDLDDYCLAKVIGFALSMSSCPREPDAAATFGKQLTPTSLDNGKTERNLSLVSKRWYFLTQAQIGLYGVHRINLDKIPRGVQQKTSSRSNFVIHGSVSKRPRVLMQKNQLSASSVALNSGLPQTAALNKTSTALVGVATAQDALNSTNIDLFCVLRPRLLKYKNLQIDGTLTCDEFRKLLVAINAHRVEQLELRVKIEKDGTQPREFYNLPRQFVYLEKLILFWYNDSRCEYSNALTWTIFNRAINLRSVEIYLIEESCVKFESAFEQSRGDALDKLVEKYSDSSSQQSAAHRYLNRLVYKRTPHLDPSLPPATLADCSYTAMMKSLLARERNLQQVDTNDNLLIEHLIRTSDRLSTLHELRTLKFLAPIRNLELLGKLMGSKSLGTDRLVISIDNPDLLESIRHLMEDFRLNRSDSSACHVGIHLKDQKFSDFEEKIKNLIHLCRAADVTVYISAQQRVSIDCCHLMWSTGRGFQCSDRPGKCLFKINLQNQLKASVSGNTANGATEITIPFGRGFQHKINSSREDLTRFREIMKSVKKDCYHQFVKSVRDNVT